MHDREELTDSYYKWEVRESHSNEPHVIPINDLVKHEPEDCVCIPHTEPVPRSDGTIGWVILHHSLDGRELRE